MLAHVWNQIWDWGTHSPTIRRWTVRQWYEVFDMIDRDGNVPLMNYGYADENRPALTPQEEPYRCQIQMYHHVVTQIDVRGLDVLEVGSGRGGGAAYVTRALQPRTYTGVDIAARAIAFCEKRHRGAGLKFVHGDAEQLAFHDASFDAVINIESSSHYGDIEKFFAEVKRVLRPDGFFLYADIWTPNLVPSLREKVARAGLALQRIEDMVPQVLRGLDADHARRAALIQRYTPKFLRQAMMEFAGTHGSTKYEMFRRAEVQYLCCLLQNANHAQSVPGA